MACMRGISFITCVQELVGISIAGQVFSSKDFGSTTKKTGEGN
jgi:hypothetical protein